MFQNYGITPDNYIPDNRCIKLTPPTPKQPLVAYNAAGAAVGFTWYYGDVITLTFSTDVSVEYDDEDLYEEGDTYLQGKKMKLLVYDFRYEVLYEEIKDAAEEVSFIIDENISTLFVKGTYKFQFVLIDDTNKTQQTLLGGDDCVFYVK